MTATAKVLRFNGIDKLYSFFLFYDLVFSVFSVVKCLFFRNFVSFMAEISVLIPTYNDRVYPQVLRLHDQLEQLAATDGLRYEIVVGDDCSTDEAVRCDNAQLLTLPHCRIMAERCNVGRAAIRNHLAQSAQYAWLLYVDAALFVPDGFVAGYIQCLGEAQVVCGGSMVDAHSQPQGLRYHYESVSASRFSAANRAHHPYRSFRTNNFLIARSLLLSHPLRADIRTYGYEDVLFGKTLEAVGASILHIDNPVCYRRLEENAHYLHKVEESLHTLYAYREELEGFSPLLDGVSRLDHVHLVGLLRVLYSVVRPFVLRNLKGRNPSLFLFNMFKVGTYLQLVSDAKPKS